MSQHTPGPWIVGELSGSGEADSCKQFAGKPYRETSSVLSKFGERFKMVAHVYQGGGPLGSPVALGEQTANARLIATAPDLLDLLAGLLATAKVVDAANKANHIDRCCGFSPELFAQCDAIIAQATGSEVEA